MKFMASQGYFVIGAEGESYDSEFFKYVFESAINTARDSHNLSLSKLAVMGHSQGGGQAFYVMNYFRNQGYGNASSLVLYIDGWFSFNMNQADLEAMDSTVSFIQMNGVHGTGIDPKIPLSIWNLLDNSPKSYFMLPQYDHNYVSGDLQNVLAKKDLLFLIGALTQDAFTGSEKGMLPSLQIIKLHTVIFVMPCCKIQQDMTSTVQV